MHLPPHPCAQELAAERDTRQRLEAESGGRESAAAGLRASLAAVTAERNSLSGLVDDLRGQLAAKGADLAGRMEEAAAAAAAKAAADAGLREAERARSRAELEAAQLREVGVGRRGGGVAMARGAWGLRCGVGSGQLRLV